MRFAGAVYEIDDGAVARKHVGIDGERVIPEANGRCIHDKLASRDDTDVINRLRDGP